MILGILTTFIATSLCDIFKLYNVWLQLSYLQIASKFISDPSHKVISIELQTLYKSFSQTR